MANLDQLLREIEAQQATEQEENTTLYKIRGQEFEVRTLTSNDRKGLMYAVCDFGKNTKTEKMVKTIKPYIYKSFTELPQLAVKAKDAGLITAYHDIVEEVFTIPQILTIMAYLLEFNNIIDEEIQKEIDEQKKQLEEI